MFTNPHEVTFPIDFSQAHHYFASSACTWISDADIGKAISRIK